MGQRRRSCWVFQAEPASAKAPRWECARRNSKDTRETGTRRARGGDKLREAAGQTCEAMAASDSEGRETTRGRDSADVSHGILRLRGENNMLGERVWRRKAGEATATTKSFTGGSDRRGEVEMVKSGQIWETV